MIQKRSEHLGHYEPVQFPSEGAMLRGRLYLPSSTRPSPLVIMAHGFSATVAMTTDHYAKVFADRGLAVLLYDHHSLGMSDGEPRRVVNPWMQIRGYRDALEFARGLQDIDASRIGLWGDSLSGMEVIVVSALLDGVAAASVMTPACGDQPPPADEDGKLYEGMREHFESGDVRASGQTVGPMPVVSWDPHRHPAHLEPLTAFRWFMEYGGRPGSGWLNDATRLVPTNLNAGVAARHVRIPMQVIYAPDDEIRRASPAVTRVVCDALSGPKEIVQLDQGCGHFGQLWYPSDWFDFVSSRQVAFYRRYLDVR